MALRLPSARSGEIGPGTLTLAGTNTYTGATRVSGGTLTAGSAGGFASGSAFTVNATLDLNGFNESIGSLTGSGTVTNSGVSAPATLTDGADGTSTIFVGAIQDGTSSTALTKVGPGTLTLAGLNTYTGGTDISAGTLSVNDSIASSSRVTVDAGGTLDGTGTVAATTINDGGTLAPGDSIGTLTVSGNLVLDSGATYSVQVSSSAASETIVTGSASIAGTFTADTISGSYSGMHTYTVLHSTGLLSGTFSSLTHVGNGGATFSLSYDAHDVFLTVVVDPGPSVTNTTTAGEKVAHGTTVTVGTAAPGLPGDTLSLHELSGPVGAVTLSNGIVSFAAPANANGNVAFSYQIRDQLGDVSPVISDTLAVDPGPTAGNTHLYLSPAQSANLTSFLLALDTPGLPGDALTLSAVGTLGTRGTVSLSKGNLSYTAPTSGSSDAFTYTVSDQLHETAIGSVSVSLLGTSGSIALTGSGNSVVAGNGNYSITGGTGGNSVSLGNGNDSMSLPGSNNTVVLGGGNDTVSLSGSNNTATLGNGNDSVTAGAGSTITLGKGNDTVYARGKRYDNARQRQ